MTTPPRSRPDARRAAAILLGSAVILAAATPPARGQGHPAHEAAARMTLAEGLEAALVAAEPDVRQTIFVKYDDRGRLWTIQYLQYPNPAGLERVAVDRWSRTTYDRTPEPPPRGPRGADRITICADRDGDGRADSFRDFLDGLNLVTGIEFGHGGVFVLNVPYLLFYPDRDRDDVPDGAPEVLLSGFGMEDAQSLANHLTWGPDGWLYGVNGSTTTCVVRGIEFQSGVWRYHPLSREFELFSEGGYNCFGLAFDRTGEMFVSTNGGPFLHAMQGAVYYKSFGKHGPLHHPHAHHHFPILRCDAVPGGPPTGGTVYRSAGLPAQFRDTFIAGNFLGHSVSWWRVIPRGSTFDAAFGGVLLDAHDSWFGPTDLAVGPGGTLAVSDFHDERTAHPDPDATWDRRNGRIFAVRPVGAHPAAPVDLAALPSDALVDLLTGPDAWAAERARVELAGRRDAAVAPRLEALTRVTDDEARALAGLWGLLAVGCLDEALALELFAHPAPAVRRWAVRVLGDRREISPRAAAALLALARRETDLPTLAQIASSARRLPPHQGVPVALAVLATPEARRDDRVPWLVWWAIEPAALAAPDMLLGIYGVPEAWIDPARRDDALRLLRRWAADGSEAGDEACAAALESVPGSAAQAAFEALRRGLAERGAGLPGIGQGGLYESLAVRGGPSLPRRAARPVAPRLRAALGPRWRATPDDPVLLEAAIRAGVPESGARLIELLAAAGADEERRLGLLRILRDTEVGGATGAALAHLAPGTPDAVVVAALDALDAHATPSEIEALVDRYAALPPAALGRARDLFFSRPGAALAFLRLVEQGSVDAATIPVGQLAPLALHHDPAIDAIVLAAWGRVGPGTPEEKLATMRRLANDLRAGPGDAARGKALFARHCATCHVLFGEGNRIGPELTGANRGDTAALLANLVDPSAVIRADWLAHTVVTRSGRVLTGLLAEQDAATVTVLDAQNRRVAIPRDDIESIDASAVSLMPERLLEQLAPGELRDLFAWLQQ